MGSGLVYPMMSAIFSDPHAGILPSFVMMVAAGRTRPGARAAALS